MSEKVFRQYRIFVCILFLCAFAFGCFLGALPAEKETPERLAETTAVPVQTQLETVPPTTLSLEQELYAAYSSSYEKTELADLDGDGVSELLIYNGDTLIEVAAISDGAVVQVLADYALFRCEGGIIGRYSEGAGGCTGFFYEIKEGKANCVECLVYHWQEDAWYRSPDHSANDTSLVPISEAERQSILERYPCVEENADESLIRSIYG